MAAYGMIRQSLIKDIKLIVKQNTRRNNYRKTKQLDLRNEDLDGLNKLLSQLEALEE